MNYNIQRYQTGMPTTALTNTTFSIQFYMEQIPPHS